MWTDEIMETKPYTSRIEDYMLQWHPCFGAKTRITREAELDTPLGKVLVCERESHFPNGVSYMTIIPGIVASERYHGRYGNTVNVLPVEQEGRKEISDRVREAGFRGSLNFW